MDIPGILFLVVVVGYAILFVGDQIVKLIRNKRNTYKLFGDEAVPVYPTATPRSYFFAGSDYLLPGTTVVISETITFMHIACEGGFWINSRDVITVDNKLFAKNTVLLLDANGNHTTRIYLKGSPITLYGETITYGSIKSKGWINMVYAKKIRSKL